MGFIFLYLYVVDTLPPVYGEHCQRSTCYSRRRF